MCVAGDGEHGTKQTKTKQHKEDKIEHSNYFNRSALIMCLSHIFYFILKMNVMW